MELIDRNELKEKLDRGDNFRLVMVLEERHYRAVHIPHSVHIPAAQIVHEELDPDGEIVVYCASETSPASMVAYNRLNSHGYRHVRRYAGGIFDWERAGYPLEGEMVE